MKVLLPGLDKQLQFLLSKIDISKFNSLVMGSNSIELAKIISSQTGTDVSLIVDDYETLMTTNFQLGNSKNVKIKLMNFERTDFIDNQFDLIYSQASITNNRNNIIKEFKRIISDNGILCIGEIVKLKNNVPTYIQKIFNSSDLKPIFIDNYENFYKEKYFQLIDSIDLSHTLPEFYKEYLKLLKTHAKKLSGSEKSYYKKIINKISHESNAYLNLGGNKYLGFKAVILKKG